MSRDDLSQYPEYRFLAKHQQQVRTMLNAAFRGGWDPGEFIVVLVDGHNPHARIAVQDWRLPFENNVACVAMQVPEASRLMRALHHQTLDFTFSDAKLASVTLPRVFIVTEAERGVLYCGRVPLAGLRGLRLVELEEPKAA